MTALILSSMHGYANQIRVLIAAGANVNQCRVDGMSALYMCTLKGGREVVETLIELGADVNHNRVTINNTTALICASTTNQVEIVDALIKAGADVNHIRADGVSALMLAGQEGCVKVVKLLLAANADPIAALHVTEYSQRKVVTRIIKAHIAQKQAEIDKNNSKLNPPPSSK